MPNFNIITSIFNLPQESLSFINDSTLLLKLPVTSHSCPCCNTITSKIHSLDWQHFSGQIFRGVIA